MTVATASKRRSERDPWEVRVEGLNRRYPSTAETDWTSALRDYDLMGRVLRDVLRVGHTPNRRGQRPLLDADEGMDRLRQLLGDDYSTLPFKEAFAVLAGTLSRTQLARKTGLGRTQVHRLLAGEVKPSGTEMEQVAAAFGKPAIYFLEYRVAVVCTVVAAHLTNVPEVSVGIVRQLGATR